MSDVTSWLALGPPYLVVAGAGWAWLRSRKLRRRIDWLKLARAFVRPVDREDDRP